MGGLENDTSGFYTIPSTLLDFFHIDNQMDGSDLAVQNFVRVLNKTIESDEIRQSWKRYQTNLFIDGYMLYFLIFVYGLLISFGTVGNCLTVCAVVRKSSMRTPRNMFIINLAVSDLLLCVVSMPLTLIQIVTAYW